MSSAALRFFSLGSFGWLGGGARLGGACLSAALLLALVPGCSTSDDVAVETDGSNEQQRAKDGGARDDGRVDGDDDDAPVTDGGSDAGGDVTITEILGTLSGPCGLVRSLLGSPDSALVTDNLVFVDGETYERGALSSGGQELYDTPNAGGSSSESEVISYEVLHYCEGASLLKTETEIDYQGGGAITDILVEIDGKKVGVSVTRSWRPSNQSYTDADVKALLEKKLKGINESSSSVVPVDKWVKQVLHVFTADKAATQAVERVFPTVTKEVRADTIVLVTETSGGGFVYCRPAPPLGKECP